jgi:SEC-C motif
MKRNMDVLVTVLRRKVIGRQPPPVSRAMQDAVYDTSFTKVGVGRNQPCPCGSGQKFKHCCRREALVCFMKPMGRPDPGSGVNLKDDRKREG